MHQQATSGMAPVRASLTLLSSDRVIRAFFSKAVW